MSTATTIVAAIDTAVLELTSKKISSFEIDGVKYTYAQIDDLLEARKRYEGIVGTENAIANSTAPFGITGLKAGSAK